LLIGERASETLSGVYHFEICDNIYNVSIYMDGYVKHNSSAGTY